MATYVSFSQLDACVQPALDALKADKAAYAKLLAQLGSSDAVAQHVTSQCLASLGSSVTGEQLFKCATEAMGKLKADPQALKAALEQAGGDLTLLAQQVGTQCLDRLQADLGVSKPAEKKTPWGWIIGGVLALGAIGAVVYSSSGSDSE